MALSSAEIVRLLLQRDLIRAESLMEGDLLITNASRRNRNFKVFCSRGPSYLLKQPASADAATTIRHEASVYEQFHSQTAAPELHRYLPHCYGYDPQTQVLILELVQHASDLREHHARRGRFSTRLAQAVGAALGTLHRLTRTDSAAWKEPGQPAWALSAHRLKHGAIKGTSKAGLQLIRIIQEFPEFCTLLDELHAGWQNEAIIHHDLKWDNIVITTPPSPRPTPEIKLVDWELAGRGDPCWDAGSVFQDYLSFWLNGIPITGQVPPERFTELARYPLDRMQPAMHAFWRSYVAQMGLDSATAQSWLLRSVRYTGARLIQTAYESMQTSMQVTGNIISRLQLSWNILRQPQKAAVHLIGIPPEKGGSL